MKPILDMTSGGRMFWFDKQNSNAIFTDERSEVVEMKDRGHMRKLEIKPDVIADFRNLPFQDESFYLVVFDPPHLLRAGPNSWLRKKYGVLNHDTWQLDLNQGFHEAMRVLKPYGTLIFKWNEEQIKTSEVLKHIDYKPLFGDKRAKTRWMVFMKEEKINGHNRSSI
ncbi:class I SAM-dependent methyltransferase [Agrilactobacillus fermenti]|uniref:class I SAM-dependent methyltransferase n=1 Tax=Agrilactobacillus fermenti TaxID=2586909 RepID=UPI003A5C20F8